MGFNAALTHTGRPARRRKLALLNSTERERRQDGQEGPTITRTYRTYFQPLMPTYRDLRPRLLWVGETRKVRRDVRHHRTEAEQKDTAPGEVTHL